MMRISTRSCPCWRRKFWRAAPPWSWCTARYDLGDTQVAVRVYDRYFMRNASRASLTLTLVGHGGTVQVSAIGAGGGTGAFTHFDWGTGDAFVQLVKKILSKGPFEGM